MTPISKIRNKVIVALRGKGLWKLLKQHAFQGIYKLVTSKAIVQFMCNFYKIKETRRLKTIVPNKVKTSIFHTWVTSQIQNIDLEEAGASSNKKGSFTYKVVVHCHFYLNPSLTDPVTLYLRSNTKEKLEDLILLFRDTNTIVVSP